MDSGLGEDIVPPRYVVVTGGGKGIGLAIAEAFAQLGYSIMLCGRNEANLQVAADTLRGKFANLSVQFYPADLSELRGVESFAAWCLQHGTPSILVNNAGSYLPGNSWEEPEGQMEKMLNTNFYSAYNLSRRLLPAMVQQGSGHIFNICSVASLQAYEGGGSYSVSKFALHGFTQNLRHELKKTGIKVTGVYPGAVMTDTWGDFDNSANRIMEASDVAKMVVAASQLSGQAVVEDILLRPQLGDL